MFAHAFALIRKAPLPIFGICLLFGSVPQLVWDLAEPRLRTGIPDDSSLSGVLDLAPLGLSLWLQTVLQATLTVLAMDSQEGRTPSFPKYVAIWLRWALPLMGLTIVNAVVVTTGSLLLLVPGMVLMVIWSVSASVLVVERVGFLASLRRSAQLTKGARWPTFGLILLIVGFILGLGLTIDTASVAMGFDLAPWADERRGTPAYLSWMLGAETLIAALWSMLMASLYVELRNRHDGPAADRLAEVFS